VQPCTTSQFGVRKAIFDPGMLRRIRTYQRVIGRGIDRITMPDTVLDRRGQIDASVVTAASELYAVAPTPRRVRVTGRLDVMGASQGVLKLDVRPSEIVTALWDGEEPVETLREFFNRDVVVEGIGVFRPSGSGVVREGTNRKTRMNARDVARQATHECAREERLERFTQRGAPSSNPSSFAATRKGGVDRTGLTVSLPLRDEA
jgi:hypothetical protein